MVFVAVKVIETVDGDRGLTARRPTEGGAPTGDDNSWKTTTSTNVVEASSVPIAIAAPIATRTSASVGAFAAACIRENRSPNRTTPIPPIIASADPSTRSTSATVSISSPSVR